MITPYETEIFYDPMGMKLWEKRHMKVAKILQDNNISRVCDIGCNVGKFINRLTFDDEIHLIVGVDKDFEALEKAYRYCQPKMSAFLVTDQRKEQLKIHLYQADILKNCSQLNCFKFDAITLIEVIEHVYRDQVSLIEENIFGILNTKLIIVTTPNYEFNRFFNEKAEIPKFRDPDHKYEMTRTEFENWANEICYKYGYIVTFDGVGLPKNEDISRGYCTQIAIFHRLNEKNITRYINLPPQELTKSFDIIYPFVSILEKFISTLKYVYYSEKSRKLIDLENWDDNNEFQEEREDIQDEENYPFLDIELLIQSHSLKVLVNNNIEEFYRLYEQIEAEKENFELDLNKKKFRYYIKENESNEDDNNEYMDEICQLTYPQANQKFINLILKKKEL